MKAKLFFIAAMAVLIISCDKTGPAGPAGANGSNGLNGNTGATGPAGANGTNGTNGTANIKTNIYTVTAADWTTITAGASYEVGFSDANITDADSDAVELSISGASTGPWVALPGTNIASAGDQISFSYQNSEAIVDYLFTSAPTTTLYFKLTVIPPAEIRRRSANRQFLQN